MLFREASSCNSIRVDLGHIRSIRTVVLEQNGNVVLV